MKKIGVILFIFFVLLSIFAFKNNTEEVSTFNTGKAKVEWMNFEEALEKSKTEPRKIFIDVYTEWCGWCKRMDSATFQQEHIAEYLNEH